MILREEAVCSCFFEKKNHSRFSVLISMSFVAGTVGPILGTQLVHNLNYNKSTPSSHICLFLLLKQSSRASPLAVYLLMGCCHLANVAYVLAFVPEIQAAPSQQQQQQQQQQERSKRLGFRDLFSLDHLVDSFRAW